MAYLYPPTASYITGYVILVDGGLSVNGFQPNMRITWLSHTIFHFIVYMSISMRITWQQYPLFFDFSAPTSSNLIWTNELGSLVPIYVSFILIMNCSTCSKWLIIAWPYYCLLVSCNFLFSTLNSSLGNSKGIRYAFWLWINCPSYCLYKVYGMNFQNSPNLYIMVFPCLKHITYLDFSFSQC